jgi:hypothetical protein
MKRAALTALTTVFLAAFGCSSDCQSCVSGCRNGVVTMCAVLDPPGCGSQALTVTCPYGCSLESPNQCNHSLVDGGAGDAANDEAAASTDAPF